MAEDGEGAYASPVVIVGGDLLGFREAEDALLEAEFRVGRAHWNAYHMNLLGHRFVGESQGCVQ